MTVGIFKELGILWDFELKKETEEIYLLFIFLNDKNIFPSTTEYRQNRHTWALHNTANGRSVKLSVK